MTDLPALLAAIRFRPNDESAWLALAAHYRDNGRDDEAAAVLYSVVGTCRRLGLDPFTYLRDAPTRLPTVSSARTGELRPDHWAKDPARAGP